MMVVGEGDDGVRIENRGAPFRSRAVAALGVVVAVLLAIGMSGCSSAGSTSTSGSSAGTSTTAPVEITISAASSLKSVLTSTAPAFEKANNAKVSFNFGASGQLVKQVEGGAPVDVFLSASPAAVATLVAEGLASGDTSATFAGNTLVILVPKGNPAGIHGPGDLKKATKLTTGDPAVAPHGQKAQEWLTGLGLWKTLLPKFVFTANAAQTDDYIARGEVDAGIGFASDAHGRSDIEIAYTVPDTQIKPIKYVGAVVTSTKEAALAKAYLDYLLSPETQSAFVNAGFRSVSAK
jgi:molybdate transport system substrate-binding protein